MIHSVLDIEVIGVASVGDPARILVVSVLCTEDGLYPPVCVCDSCCLSGTTRCIYAWHGIDHNLSAGVGVRCCGE